MNYIKNKYIVRSNKTTSGSYIGKKYNLPLRVSIERAIAMSFWEKIASPLAIAPGCTSGPCVENLRRQSDDVRADYATEYSREKFLKNGKVNKRSLSIIYQ